MTDYSGYGLVALREECEEMGIKFSEKDTAEALRKKLPSEEVVPEEELDEVIED